MGVISAWGNIEVHRTGFRAEFAKPLALFRFSWMDDAFGGLVETFARAYDAEIWEAGQPGELDERLLATAPGLGVHTIDGWFDDFPIEVRRIDREEAGQVSGALRPCGFLPASTPLPSDPYVSRIDTGRSDLRLIRIGPADRGIYARCWERLAPGCEVGLELPPARSGRPPMIRVKSQTGSGALEIRPATAAAELAGSEQMINRAWVMNQWNRTGTVSPSDPPKAIYLLIKSTPKRKGRAVKKRGVKRVTGAKDPHRNEDPFG